MVRSLMLSALGVALVFAIQAPLQAPTQFKKALQEEYSFKSVSCYVCHVKGKDAEGKTLGKEHRNEFGEVLSKLLEGTDVTKKIMDAKEAYKEDHDKEKRDAVYDAATEEFKKALEKAKPMKSKDGPTWDELLKGAKLEGLKTE